MISLVLKILWCLFLLVAGIAVLGILAAGIYAMYEESRKIWRQGVGGKVQTIVTGSFVGFLAVFGLYFAWPYILVFVSDVI